MLTQIIQDARLLVADVVMCNRLPREDFRPGEEGKKTGHSRRDTACADVSSELIITTPQCFWILWFITLGHLITQNHKLENLTMTPARRLPAPDPKARGSAGSAAGQSTCVVCCSPRSPSSRSLHSVEQHHRLEVLTTLGHNHFTSSTHLS